jgi:DNA-binding MarR family transcriptional regulator
MEEVMEDASESAVRAARDLVVVFSRLRHRLREVADIQGLTPSQTSVLSRLGKDGASSASALAAVERIRPQSMAATLAALDRHGLIQRHQDPEDGRKQLVTLTAAGHQRVKGDRQARQEWLVRALREHFTEEQRQVVIEAMALVDGLTHI